MLPAIVGGRSCWPASVRRDGRAWARHHRRGVGEKNSARRVVIGADFRRSQFLCDAIGHQRRLMRRPRSQAGPRGLRRRREFRPLNHVGQRRQDFWRGQWRAGHDQRLAGMRGREWLRENGLTRMISAGPALGHPIVCGPASVASARGQQARQIAQWVPRQFVTRALRGRQFLARNWNWPKRNNHNDDYVNQHRSQQSIARRKAGNPTGTEIKRRVWGVRTQICN